MNNTNTEESDIITAAIVDKGATQENKRKTDSPALNRHWVESQGILRLAEKLEDILLLRDRLVECLGLFDPSELEGFTLHLGLDASNTTIQISRYDQELAHLMLDDDSDTTQLTADTITIYLEGGSPAHRSFADFGGAVCWICQLTARLVRLENTWPKEAIATALHVRENFSGEAWAAKSTA